MLEPVTKEIDGFQFKYQPMMATPARTLFDKLVNRFGPTVASAMEGMDDAKDLSLEDNTAKVLGAVLPALGRGLREFSGALNENFHRELVKELGAKTTVCQDDGKEMLLTKDNQELFFAQRLTTEFKWIAFCLEVQFSDFFELLRTAAQTAVASKALKNESLFSSQKTSTGLYNESPQASDTAVD